MKKAIFILLMFFTSFVFAGPNQDRVQSFMDALAGASVSTQAVSRVLDASLITYQAWLPYEDVTIGAEDCGPPEDPASAQCEVTESRVANTSAWTNERKAKFFLRVVRKELRQRVREVAEQTARRNGRASANAVIKAAGDDSQTGL